MVFTLMFQTKNKTRVSLKKKKKKCDTESYRSQNGFFSENRPERLNSILMSQNPMYQSTHKGQLT